MSGAEVVKIIERELFLKDISKGEFYQACGLNSTTISNWRNEVYTPSPAKLHVIEDYLGIKFPEENVATGMTEEEAELLQSIRERSDLKVLFRSARGVPPSSVYEIVARLEKMKESAD